jgi:hypothetical protein
MDALYLAIIFVFFAASWWLVRLCSTLGGGAR